MILALVRHGETDYNKELRIQGNMDNVLNDTGRMQAFNAAKYLIENDNKWDYIYTSPLKRASQTANIISSELGMKVSSELPLFVERDFGPFEGEYIKDVYPRIVDNEFTEDGYENNEKMIKRIVDATFDLSKKHQNDKVLLVAHAHVVKSLCIYSDPSKYDFIENYTPNSSISYFEIKDNKIKLINIITF